MDNIDIGKLIEVVHTYDPEGIHFIKQVYDFAFLCHDGVLRKSGEPYITHPVKVAYALSLKRADRDTIAAALLHDVVEDCGISIETISAKFNPEIAFLVDGVTKLSKVKSISSEMAEIENTSKLFEGITKDVRIILIKLEDRLHNMSTLEYLPLEKQIKIASQTMKIYIPLAYYLGAYDILGKLEDLTFKYLNPEAFKEISLKLESDKDKGNEVLEEVLEKVNGELSERGIPHQLRYRIKNVYGTYQKMLKHQSYLNIHDLLCLKVICKDVDDCYRGMGVIHGIYRPLPYKFKDYIAVPKTNKYSSLHTTVFGPKGRLVQNQLRTKEMDIYNNLGIASYWYFYPWNAKSIMQFDLSTDYQFFKYLSYYFKKCDGSESFLKSVSDSLLSNNIYTFEKSGATVELPMGSTVLDFAFKTDEKKFDYMCGAIVNGELVENDFILKPGNIVEIQYSDRVTLNCNLDDAQTMGAKIKIKEIKLAKDNKMM